MSISELISPLVGRVILGWFFISEALSYGRQWEGTIQLMMLKDVPAPALLLALGIVVMLIGGLSLLLGFQARHGALLLFAFTIAASVLMHPYWRIENASARSDDYEIFVRNIAIAGGLLMIMGLGSGPLSLDNRAAPPKKKR